MLTVEQWTCEWVTARNFYDLGHSHMRQEFKTFNVIYYEQEHFALHYMF
jgi:hypothetical protein